MANSERNKNIMTNLQSGATKDSKREVGGTAYYTKVANSILVASSNENADAVTNLATTNTINTNSSQQPIGETSSSRETSASSVSLIRKQFKDRGLSTTAVEVLESAWRAGTRKQYEGHLERWRQYCYQRHINPFSPTVEEGINFLAELFKKGLGYSALNTARSALSSIVSYQIVLVLEHTHWFADSLKESSKIVQPYQGTPESGMYE
ncbi:uncharacterized protein LOC124450864 [Xenia sp. Carnegie-2017]|uniref:uncharacterized protein LOC124450864 n=1 Tax=Xenia sp. Carnegie-2017 TaxID=2897299 RepID=UPI001F04D9D0|nr:uncharacterized protein LOC124450864 [Xenia sp. Carnegie-2017]